MNFNIISMLKELYSNSKHVLGISYKPTTDAFRKTLKIVLLGTIAIGILGFIISIIIGFLV